jgi:hypothetical protein
VVLEGDLYRSAPLSLGLAGLDTFLSELPVSRQGATDCLTLYQCWIDRLTALRAASVTGTYPVDIPNSQACHLNDALNEHDLLLRDIANLRSRAAKEKQLSRRVDLNLRLKDLESRLAETANLL